MVLETVGYPSKKAEGKDLSNAFHDHSNQIGKVVLLTRLPLEQLDLLARVS